MSRITGKDALGLFEAYQAVYNTQDLTEEQIWEEVENWVNSLLEEGHDLSGYTWEDMYEAYIQEARAEGAGPYRPGMGGVKRTLADINASTRKAESERIEAGAKKPAYKDRTGKTEGPLITVNPGDPKDAAKALHRTRQRPHSRTGNPVRIMGGDIGKGSTRVGAATLDIVKGSERNIARANRLPDGDKKPKVSKEIIRKEHVDIYDLILSHLLDEGYANSVDAAEKIMVNMSEEWRESIVEDIRGAITYNPNTPIGRLKRRIKGSTPEKREARTRDYQGNKSDTAERFGGSQRAPYDDNRGDIPALRGK